MKTIGMKAVGILALAAGVLATAGLAATARAGEKPIGKAVVAHGMQISAVYLQPVTMEPAMPTADGRPDIHLEVVVRATKDNPNGFMETAWIPYLTIAYHLAKIGSDWRATGSLMPMVANDGPHYGANVALSGPGKYRLTLEIAPPIKAGFFRHTDKETGVAKWWAPIAVHRTFTYVGVGKKGTY